MLKDNEKLAVNVNENIVPSMAALNKFSFQIFESKHLLTNWILFEKESNTPKKLRLTEIIQNGYPQIKYEIKQQAKQWNKTEQLKLNQIFNLADSYFSQVTDIINGLNNIEAYNAPDFESRYVSIIKEGDPLPELADNIKSQIDEMYENKNDILLSYNIKIEKSFKIFSNRILFSGIVLLFTVIIIAFLMANATIFPIKYIKNIIRKMSFGELPSQSIKTSTDEIGEMGEALSNLITNLKQKVEFAKEIERGNFRSFFEISGEHDILGSSLLSMRDSLSEAYKYEEIRRKENEERSWAAQGLSEFNDLIREHSKTLEEFSLVSINKLTRYTESQIGGIYILNEENVKERFLELVGFYAYDRHKFFEEKIYPGENLIGQCFLEKDTIFITDVPENYIKISSGLGKENPKSILIVPLILNQKVYGVVELASVEIFTKYKIEFVEKIAELLASTVASIQINIQRTKLIEETKDKSETEEQEKQELQKKIIALENELKIKSEGQEKLLSQIQQLQTSLSESKKNTDDAV
ncbi:MAG: GAF domain-containing protein [Bacteroidales bacterium]|nr:GAF domain-containing protein [Bacteroidales bacterium]